MESTNPRSNERATGGPIQAMFDQVDDMIRQDRAALPLLATVFGLLAYRCRQALGAWYDLETTSAAIPLKEIRRELGRVIQATEELNRLQESIPLPPEAELDAMIEGKLPVSEEAYVLALLQYSVLKLEAGGFCIREDLHKWERSNPAWRSSWSTTDAYVRYLLGAVKHGRSLKQDGADPVISAE